MGDDKRDHDWNVWIPVILWIWGFILSLIKVCFGHAPEAGAREIVLMAVNEFNGNTFSTFFSVTACMLCQHLSTPMEKRMEKSSLVMSRIREMLVMLLFYVSIAVLDAAINHPVMAVIYLVANVVYVTRFFCAYIVKNERRGKRRKEGQEDDS